MARTWVPQLSFLRGRGGAPDWLSSAGGGGGASRGQKPNFSSGILRSGCGNMVCPECLTCLAHTTVLAKELTEAPFPGLGLAS